MTNTKLQQKTYSNGPNEIKAKGKIINTRSEIVKQLNDFFVEIGPNLAKKTAGNYKKFLTPLNQDARFQFRPVTESEIFKIINGMKPKMSYGENGLSNKLLKHLIIELTYPLTTLINISLENNYVPSSWKVGKIIPILKSGEKNLCTNYRPISLLSTLSKVIEKVVDMQIRGYLESNELIYRHQYGFRKSHETTHAVIDFTNFIYKARELGELSLSIGLDCKKAFDTCDHEILLEKIDQLGLPKDWFKSYLTERNQYVYLDGTSSPKRLITTGVPQGSILGPLLFIIYINDLQNTDKESLIILFADDTTILLKAKDKDALIKKTGEILGKLEEWFDANKMTLHPGKTIFMTFGIREDINLKLNGQAIEQVGEGRTMETMKFLGILIDDQLKWGHHILQVRKKIIKGLMALKMCKNKLNKELRLLIYNAYVKSHLEYGLSIWGKAQSSLIKQLETVQKRCIRAIVGAKWNAHTSKHFKDLSILKLKDLVCLNLGKLGYKAVTHKLPSPLNEIWNKKKYAISIRTADTNLEKKIPSKYINKNMTTYNVPDNWNNLALEVRNSKTYLAFKKLFKSLVLEQYIEDCLVQNCYVCLKDKN